MVANHLVDPNVDLRVNSGSDSSWVWVAQDFAEEDKATVQTFAIRFKTPEIAKTFKEKYELMQETNRRVLAEEQVDILVDSERKEEASSVSSWRKVFSEGKGEKSKLSEQVIKELFDKYSKDSGISLPSSSLGDLINDIVEKVGATVESKDVLLKEQDALLETIRTELGGSAIPVEITWDSFISLEDISIATIPASSS